MPAPSPSTQTPVASAPTTTRSPVTTRAVRFAKGLLLDVPLGWQTAATASVNRATQRWVLVGNGDLASLATVPGNGDIDMGAFPNDRVVVEVVSYCGLMCVGPTAETRLPLDWSTATPHGRAAPPAKHELAIGLRWFDDPMFLIARWSDGAPAADIAAIDQIAGSVRPEVSPPPTGGYMGWDGIGPLANIPIGSVTLRPLPAGAALPPRVQGYDLVPYYVVRGRQNVYAFSSQPLVDKRCSLQYDATSDRFWCQIDDRRVEWTRFGRFLGPEPASDLVQHRVIVRDGDVWVWYAYGTMRSPAVQDEEAER